MRTISAPSLAKLAQNLGTEPVNIIEVQWNQGGSFVTYADDEDLSLQLQTGIMEISGLDAVLQIDSSGQLAEINITLDDTEGDLKAIINQYDIHKRTVRVYQWFKGLALSEKFLLFQGQINSPVVWKESDRTLSFAVVSKLEDKEIGFSPEEGVFESIPIGLVGKPWPMVFGTVLDIPAVQVSEEPVGQLMTGTGFVDFTLPIQIALIQTQAAYLFELSLYYALAAGVAAFNGDEELEQQLEAQSAQFAVQSVQYGAEANELRLFFGRQRATETSPIRILNGNLFPQGQRLVLALEGGNGGGVARIEGSFDGDVFSIVKREHPEAVNFGISRYDKDPDNIVDKHFPQFADSLSGVDGQGNPISIPGSTIVGDSAGYFWADAGSRVYIDGNRPVDFVVSIVPGTVLKVAAYQTVEGTKQLFTVPESYYSVFTKNYGSINAVIVRLNKPLTAYPGEAWDSKIYVTFQSSIGPNTVDILEYLIELYTEFPVDTASFAHVRSRLTAYPSNFAILDRKNIVTALQEIAMMARCSIWVTDKFYLRYLPEEPDSSGTISESDIRPAQSLELHHTDTEEIVTKLTASWRESYAQEELNRIILRHNVKKYGIQEREIEWYIYNNQELVLKSATFWLIRWANTWKRLIFSTPLKHLNLETLDGVTLDFDQTYVASAAVKGIVEKAVYNSAEKQIDFEIWLPIKMGTMVPYDFAWPADISQQLIFPTVQETQAGFAGGNGPGAAAQGTINRGNEGVGDAQVDNNLFNRGYSDKGDQYPSDQGDVAPPPPGGVMNAPIDSGRPQGIDTPPYRQDGTDTGGTFGGTINLRTTRIFDPQTNQRAPLATFFKEVSDETLIGATDSLWKDEDENTGPFAFKWDEENSKFAADIAYLED